METTVEAGFPVTWFHILWGHVTWLFAASASILKAIESKLGRVILQDFWSFVIVLGHIFPLLIAKWKWCNKHKTFLNQVSLFL